jgi:DNA-binding transcriptional LysR family regulator
MTPRRRVRSALGCYQVFAPYVVPALVARLTKLHPGHRAQRCSRPIKHICIASLRRSDIEVALLYDFGLEPDLSRAARRLTPYVLLPEGHPWQATPSVALEDLAPEPLICSTWNRAATISCRCFATAAWSRSSAIAPRSFEMVRGLVGMAWATACSPPSPPTACPMTDARW